MGASISPPRRTAVSQEQRAGFDSLQKTFSLKDIRTESPIVPSTMGILGLAGIGKTTLAAYSVKPVFIMPKGETGLITLMNAGRLPQIPHFPETKTWLELRGQLEVLLREPHDYRTLVIDTVNATESLLHQFVCDTEFDADWSKSGFLSYNAGYEVALDPLRRDLLAPLDRLRHEKRMQIILLGHIRIKTFKNPEGADYDRYQPDIHEKTWALIDRWLDTVLFVNYETIVTHVTDSGKQKKGKALGGSRRFAYTERTAAYDAKNRLGLPRQIDLGEEPSEAWGRLTVAVREARRTSLLARDKQVQAPEQAQPQQEAQKQEESQ